MVTHQLRFLKVWKVEVKVQLLVLVWVTVIPPPPPPPPLHTSVEDSKIAIQAAQTKRFKNRTEAFHFELSQPVTAHSQPLVAQTIAAKGFPHNNGSTKTLKSDTVSSSMHAAHFQRSCQVMNSIQVRYMDLQPTGYPLSHYSQCLVSTCVYINILSGSIDHSGWGS